MAASSSLPVRSRAPQAKHILYIVFGLFALVTLFTRDLALLDPSSPLRQRYAHIPWLILAHGVPGALALTLGVFQFSNRLRSRYLRIHRILGRVYVGSVFIAAPVSIPVAIILGPPTLVMAATIQSVGWMLCTGVALYAIRRRNIQQHRQWMMRGYPFALVFVTVRAIIAIPAIARLGAVGIVSTVWSCVALAAFVPSVVIALQGIFPQNVAKASRATAA